MWAVGYEAGAIRVLQRLDTVTAERIRAKVAALAKNPAAPNNNVKKLTGVDAYRLRIGDWRVIYSLRHRTVTIIVIRIGHRS